MPLLKSKQAEPVLKDAIVLDLGDLEREAARIISTAKHEASRIVSDAQRESAELAKEAAAHARAEGREAGIAEGREAGRAEGRTEAIASWSEQLTSLDSRWTEAVQQWEAERDRMFHDAKDDVVRLAIAIAERVIARTIEADPTVIAGQVARTLELLGHTSALTVSVHPEDEPILKETLPALRQRIDAASHISIETGGDVERGGCVIVTAGGSINAEIPAQVDRIAAALLGENAVEKKAPQDDGTGA